MASLDMQGLFDLSNTEIDKQITKTSAGNYALGTVKVGKFTVKYVGRSDTDLNTRLKQHVGKYQKFQYSYATSPTAAFEKECKNFHDYGGDRTLDNEIHPDRPKNSGLNCPYCNFFGN